MAKRTLAALSIADKRYIEENHRRQTIEDMASALGKPRALIKTYILQELGAQPLETSPEVESLDKEVISLRSRPEWIMLRNELSDDELQYFEYKYSEYMEQLDNDVLPMEETQIFQAVEYEIQMSRMKRSQKRRLDRLRTLERQISKEEAKLEDDRDIIKIQAWESDIEQIETQVSKLVREIRDTQTKHGELNKQLKTTREQRVKNAINRQNWTEVLREWHDRANRAKKAKLLAIMRAGVDKERQRLSQYYEFPDGVDQPLLNTETIRDDNVIKDI